MNACCVMSLVFHQYNANRTGLRTKEFGAASCWPASFFFHGRKMVVRTGWGPSAPLIVGVFRSTYLLCSHCLAVQTTQLLVSSSRLRGNCSRGRSRCATGRTASSSERVSVAGAEWPHKCTHTVAGRPAGR